MCFWKRGTATASLLTLTIGFGLGITVFLIDFPAASGAIFGRYTAATAPHTHLVGQPVQLITHGLGIGFLLQAWWLFVMCSSIFVVVSLLTQAPDQDVVAGTASAALATHRLNGCRSTRILAIALLGAIAVLYPVFLNSGLRTDCLCRT